MMMDLPSLIEKYKMNITGVLHCGANEGQERDLYESVGVKEVIWVEAIPEMCDKLIENLVGYPKHSVICACIGVVNGEEVEFNVSNNASQSSSYLDLGHHSVIHPEVYYVKKIEMQLQRLDSLLTWEDLENINFGNFDLQGVELQAILSLGSLINRFDYLWVEVNKKETYKFGYLVDDIDKIMYEFQRVETGEWVADTWTDALYIRKTLL